MSYVQVDKTGPFYLSQEGKTLTLRMAKIAPSICEKTGQKYIETNAGNVTKRYYIAVEVFRHFGNVSIRPDVLSPEDLFFVDKDPTNASISNIRLKKEAKARLLQVLDAEISSVEDEEEFSENEVVIEDEEAELPELELILPNDAPKESYTIIKPKSGSYYDIVNNATGASILEKQLNGKTQVSAYLRQNEAIQKALTNIEAIL